MSARISSGVFSSLFAFRSNTPWEAASRRRFRLYRGRSERLALRAFAKRLIAAGDTGRDRRARCRERQNFAGHSGVAMSTSRDSTPLYEAIRSLVLSARQSAARGVNLLQVYTNYEIGRRIFEQEQQGADRAQYGKEIV